MLYWWPEQAEAEVKCKTLQVLPSALPPSLNWRISSALAFYMPQMRGQQEKRDWRRAGVGLPTEP